ncbi:MAG: GNAT family N-acetyltransferase [Pseudomonadota bacterium]
MSTLSQCFKSAQFPIASLEATPFLIRPSTPGDGERLRTFFDTLSSSARHNRFLSSVARVSTNLINLFATADQADHVALLATRKSERGEEIIAEARFVVGPNNRSAAEFALTVADNWQGQGIGQQLLVLIDKLARDRGLQFLWGDTVPTNKAMLCLADRVGFDRRRHPHDFKLARLEKVLAH